MGKCLGFIWNEKSKIRITGFTTELQKAVNYNFITWHILMKGLVIAKYLLEYLWSKRSRVFSPLPNMLLVVLTYLSLDLVVLVWDKLVEGKVARVRVVLL